MKLEDFASRPPSIELPEEQWRELEATLGLSEPNLSVRREIARYVAHHLGWADVNFPKQRVKAQRKWINRIEKKAAQLIEVLDWDASEDESDAGYNQMYAVWDLLSSRAEQKKLLDQLRNLHANAEGMLARLPKGKSGPDTDDFLKGLIFDLAFVYNSATKKPPTITYNDYGPPLIEYTADGNVGIYEGCFLDFIAAVLRVFSPDRAKDNSALGKRIQRVLKVWRRHSGLKDKTCS